ncbi:LysR family transcriptional regulator [Quadrisphaera setariae]|uniref:LysR family transcriptional regulator n=1 Tax=Quadrisphaera setariae TaxID=2593304 RepID=UPI0016504D89|nr:LysR family transcriptional regulator [Quadrisphaera setariae]
MNRRQLAVFLAVLDHGSLGAAASATGLAQPTVAQSLDGLEAQLGAVLVHRSSAGTTPTAAGRALEPHARQLLRGAGAAAEAVRSAGEQCAQRASGVLDVAVEAVLAADAASELLGAFSARHPGVRVQVRVAEHDDRVLESLLEGRAEVAVASLPLGRTTPSRAASELVVVPLGEQEVLVAFPPGSDDLPDPLPLAALDGRDVIGVTDHSRRERLVSRALEAVGARPRLAVETAHREAVASLVLAGAGAGFLSGVLAQWAAAEGVVLRRTRPAVTAAHALVHLRRALSPAARALVRLAEDCAP